MENEQQAERNNTLFLSDEGNLIAYNKFSTQKKFTITCFFLSFNYPNFITCIQGNLWLFAILFIDFLA